MKRSLTVNLLLALAGALLFIPGIGGVRLFDWDEINFAESAREMLLTGDWFNVQINFRPFWEKPPLFIWMQALCMAVFGVGEFAARLPNAIGGIVTLLVLYNIGRKTGGERFGLIWAVMHGASLLPFFYFKTGIIDPWFNLFIFLGICFFARYSQRPGGRSALLSGLFIGLATLTKGPVALLVFGLTFIVRLAFKRFRLSFRWGHVALWAVAFLLAGGAWFIALALSGRGDVIVDFITYQIRLLSTQDAGHGGFFLYHFVILLFGVAPASAFALSSFSRKNVAAEENPGLHELLCWMMASFWVVLILFTLVRTKIVHYSSFCWFPLSFLGAWAFARMADGKLEFRRAQGALLISTAALFGAALTALTLFDRFKEKLIPYINDPFAVSCMDASSDWRGFEPFVGGALLLATVAFCVLFRRTRRSRLLAILAAGNVLFCMTAVVCAVPEVEKYSQAGAVEFYIERQGEDCYVQPAWFKSYAQYFYTLRQPENNCDDFGFLCRGPLDKRCYFVLKDKPGAAERLLKEAPDAHFLYRHPGFLFFAREKTGDADAEQGGDRQQAKIE